MEQVLSKARDLAARGRWSDVWAHIENLSADHRMTPEVSTLRLLCCAELKSWDIGKAVAAVLASESDDESLQKAAGRFHYELAIHEAGHGRMGEALSALRQALSHAPELFHEVMRDERTSPLLKHPFPASGVAS